MRDVFNFSRKKLRKSCACHAKRENDLPFCDLGAPKRAFRARLPPLFILWSRKGLCRSACVPPNGEKLTSWRRVGDDDATTTRRRHDDEPTNTTRTQVQPQTPTINGNPSLRIRERTGVVFKPVLKHELSQWLKGNWFSWVTISESSCSPRSVPWCELFCST